MAKTGGTTKRKPKRSPGNRKPHNLALMREFQKKNIQEQEL